MCLVGAICCNKPLPNLSEERPPAPSMETILFTTSDLKHRAISLDSQKVKWEIPGKYGGYDLPCYDSGFLYLSDVYGAAGVNATTGAVLWTLDYSARNFRDNDLQYRSMPVVADSIVYVTGFTGSGGQQCLYAIHKVKGTIIWSKIYSKFYESAFSRMIVNKERIILIGQTTKGNSLLCINRLTGAIIWDKVLSNDFIFPTPFPVADDNSIYVGDYLNPKIYAFDIASGNLWWTATTNAKMERYDQMTLKGNTLTAFINRGLPSSDVYHLDKSTGTVLRHFQLTSIAKSIDVQQDTIFINSPPKAGAYSVSTNSFIWNIDKPVKRLYDSVPLQPCLKDPRSYTRSWDIFTENELITLLSLQCIVTTPVCGYNKIAFINKATGKINKELDFLNLGCQSLYAPVVLLKGGKPYYPNANYW